eukprot:g3667.t1
MKKKQKQKKSKKVVEEIVIDIADKPVDELTDDEKATLKLREERLKFYEENESVREACACNGITQAKFVKAVDEVEEIQVFQTFTFTLDAMKHFRNLRELWVLSQSTVSHMRGLESCLQLKLLAISQTKLTRIEGLENLTKLTKLFLYKNHLKKIEGLSTLINLRELWLNNNEIQVIEGLDTLNGLQTLELGANRIERIGKSLDGCRMLVSLNLSGNRIGSFQEILNLTRLPKLRQLHLGDPHFGDCPVCHLANYQTYVLYNVPQITSLDALLVSEETKKLAEATYMKKKMYYNMRIKTIKRNCSNIEIRGQEIVDKYVDNLRLSVDELTKKQHRVRFAIESSKLKKTDVIAADINQLQEKAEALEAAVKAQQTQIKEYQELLGKQIMEVKSLAQETISRLIVELETGGNIRMENGKPTDVWYTSCADLLNSRFVAADFEPMGIRGIKVVSVTRVHNRFLRNRFEMRMRELVDMKQRQLDRERSEKGGDKKKKRGKAVKSSALEESVKGGSEESDKDSAEKIASKRALEYLFFGETIELTEKVGKGREIHRCIHRGFRNSKDYYRLGLDGAVPLSNSISVVELPRLRALKLDASKRKEMNSNVTGKLLVAKVYLGNCGEEKEARRLSAQLKNESDASIDIESGKDNERIHPDDFKGYQSIFRNVEGITHSSQKQRQWHLLDPSLVLPEYLVEFEYLFEELQSQTSNSPQDVHCETQRDADDLRASDFGPFLGSMTEFTKKCKELHKIHLEDGNEAKKKTTQALAMLPELPPREQVPTVNRETLVSIIEKALSVSPEMLICLDLHGCGIRLLESLPCPNLKILLLSFNELSFLGPAAIHSTPNSKFESNLEQQQTNVESEGDESLIETNVEKENRTLLKGTGLGPLPCLEELDLSYNKISHIYVSFPSSSSPLSSPPISPSASSSALAEMLDGIDTSFQVHSNSPALSLEGMPKLRKISLASNLLHRISDIDALARVIPTVSNLDLRNTKLAKTRDYRKNILRAFDYAGINGANGLRYLDGVEVAGISSPKFKFGAKCTQHLIQAHSSTGRILRSSYATVTEAIGPGSPGASDKAEYDFDVSPTISDVRNEISPPIAPPLHQANLVTDNLWWESIICVELCGQGLCKLEHFDKLVNMRRASFANNYLEDFSGLESCHQIEELIFEENRLTDLNGLSNLRSLRSLDLGKNRIVSLNGLQNLTQLSQLSVEDNYIVSLLEISSLTALMELYVANNRLEKLNEVQHLKRLSKLIIVDLSGNALANDSQYRLYSIYHLRKLKVLDGIGVDAQELAQARETFSGKLTVEFLTEKLGHKRFAHIRELDLSSCRIRFIESLNGKDFRNLVELNLDNNLLTSLNGLECLDQLTVLRLNHNRLSSFDSSKIQKTKEEEGKEIVNISTSDGEGSEKSEEKEEKCEENMSWGFTAMNLKNLEVMHLGYNHIFDISLLGLHGLTTLKVLYLEGNELTFISGLEPLVNLQELSLDKNHIKHFDAASLANCINLRQLRIEENNLRTMSNMGLLRRLQILHAGFNRISEFRELDELAEIPSLTELGLSHNSVGRKQLYRPQVLRRMPNLRVIDGKDVTPDELERVENLFMDQRSFVLEYSPMGTHKRVGIVGMGVGANGTIGANYRSGSSHASLGISVLSIGMGMNFAGDANSNVQNADGKNWIVNNGSNGAAALRKAKGKFATATKEERRQGERKKWIRRYNSRG